MKKLSVFLIVVLMAVLLFAVTAAAVTISTSGTYYLSDYGNGETYTINPGLTVTLVGSSSVTYTNVAIVCQGNSAGIKLTLDNVRINNDANSGRTPLAFWGGSGNELYLVNDNYLFAGFNAAGV